MSKKRLLCRLGMHETYVDGAMFSSVRRCNYCDWVDDEVAARRLNDERRYWESRSENPLDTDRP